MTHGLIITLMNHEMSNIQVIEFDKMPSLCDEIEES
jgi:hypothetical protein